MMELDGESPLDDPSPRTSSSPSPSTSPSPSSSPATKGSGVMGRVANLLNVSQRGKLVLQQKEAGGGKDVGSDAAINRSTPPRGAAPTPVDGGEHYGEGGATAAGQRTRATNAKKQETTTQEKEKKRATLANGKGGGRGGGAKRTNMDGAQLKRTLSQRSNRSLRRKKYLAPGRNLASVAPSTRSHPVAGAAAYVEVGEEAMVPVVFQWPRSATEISVLFRAEGAEQWEEYSMYGDSTKGYRLMALLNPAVYHFKFWADGIYYQHPGCPLPDSFPDDFVVSFSLQFVCKHIQPEHVKKLMHKYATKTWVRHAAKLGFGPKRPAAEDQPHGLKALTQSLKKLPSTTTEPQQQKKRSISLRRKRPQNDKLTASGGKADKLAKSRTSSQTPQRVESPSLCEEEDIDTASSISDNDNEGECNETNEVRLSDADRSRTSAQQDKAVQRPVCKPIEDLINAENEGKGELLSSSVGDERFADSDDAQTNGRPALIFSCATPIEDDGQEKDEEKFYSDSSYYSSSEDSDLTDSDEEGFDKADGPDYHAHEVQSEADVTASECDDKDDDEDNDEDNDDEDEETTDYEGEKDAEGDDEDDNQQQRRRNGAGRTNTGTRRRNRKTEELQREKRRTRRIELEQKEATKESKRQKMKRGPLVRLHPKTVLPITFIWPGPAQSVELIYKSYFNAKWKSKALQPSSPGSSRWSVRITLLPGIYQTCYLVNGEHYYVSLTKRVVDPHHVLSDCNLYRFDVDTKPWLEATKKTGNLIKQGGRIKTWKHRYTTLQQHEIRYFRDDKDTEPINVIPLSSVEGDVEASELASKKRMCFQLHTPGRTYIFSSTSREDIEDWVRCINRSAFMHKNWERALAHYRPPPATYHNTV